MKKCLVTVICIGILTWCTYSSVQLWGRSLSSYLSLILGALIHNNKGAESLLAGGARRGFLPLLCQTKTDIHKLLNMTAIT